MEIVTRAILVSSLGAFLLLPLAGAHGNVGLLGDTHPPATPIDTTHLQADGELFRITSSSSVSDAQWVPAAGGNYRIHFDCPERMGGTPGEEQLAGCPLYVLDEEDIMSQPRILVDPKNPRWIGFNALHGGHGTQTPPAPAPPSERSRWNDLHQPHTTFQSVFGGADWSSGGGEEVEGDNRYYAPGPLKAENRTIYGEDNAAVLDSSGNVHLASLYAYRDSTDTDYRYAVATWKGHRLNEPVLYGEDLLIRFADGYNKIDNLHILHVRETNWIVVLWRETSTNATGVAGSPSWINGMYTKAGTGARWQSLTPEQQIPGCRGISKPIGQEGRVYVGCYPEKGNRNAAANSRNLQIYAIDTKSWTTNFISDAPIDAGTPILVDRGNAHMAVLAASLNEQGDAVVKVAYGIQGGDWKDLKDYGPDFAKARLAVAPELLEVRITAAAYAKHTGYLHVLYQERYKADVTDVAHLGPKSLFKTYGVIRPDQGFQGYFDLTFGRHEPRLYFDLDYQGGLEEGIFHDLHDDIFVWSHPKTKREQIFTVFGDYGFVRFGEIVEENPVIGLPLFPPQVPPTPLAAPGTNSLLQGAAAAAVMSLAVLRMLTVKRKQTVKAPTL